MSIVSVAAKRRGKDSPYIEGSVIDIGCGDFAIKNLYHGITKFREWDLADGDAQYMIGCEQYDTVHSSHCLEHMVQPIKALQTWIGIARKYLVIVVPDEEMYEKNTWPSLWNCDHKWSFRLGGTSALPKSIDVYKMLGMLEDVEIIKVERITQGFNPADKRDQTAFEVECAIEIILRKIND